MLRGPGKKKKHNSNPGREYVTKTFCDERFQRVVEKLESIDKKIDDWINEKKSEKKERSHALRNAIIGLIVGALIALLSYGLGRLPH